ncbi:MAG: hypothetical protein M1831_007109 [Alyxoria varia]|nr:MAG: hypothetical protein M1831_007109 [Alyxoria varia]
MSDKGTLPFRQTLPYFEKLPESGDIAQFEGIPVGPHPYFRLIAPGPKHILPVQTVGLDRNTASLHQCERDRIKEILHGFNIELHHDPPLGVQVVHRTATGSADFSNITAMLQADYCTNWRPAADSIRKFLIESELNHVAIEFITESACGLSECWPIPEYHPLIPLWSTLLDDICDLLADIDRLTIDPALLTRYADSMCQIKNAPVVRILVPADRPIDPRWDSKIESLYACFRRHGMGDMGVHLCQGSVKRTASLRFPPREMAYSAIWDEYYDDRVKMGYPISTTAGGAMGTLGAFLILCPPRTEGGRSDETTYEKEDEIVCGLTAYSVIDDCWPQSLPEDELQGTPAALIDNSEYEVLMTEILDARENGFGTKHVLSEVQEVVCPAEPMHTAAVEYHQADLEIRKKRLEASPNADKRNIKLRGFEESLEIMLKSKKSDRVIGKVIAGSGACHTRILPTVSDSTSTTPSPRADWALIRLKPDKCPSSMAEKEWNKVPSPSIFFTDQELRTSYHSPELPYVNNVVPTQQAFKQHNPLLTCGAENEFLKACRRNTLQSNVIFDDELGSPHDPPANRVQGTTELAYFCNASDYKGYAGNTGGAGSLVYVHTNEWLGLTIGGPYSTPGLLPFFYASDAARVVKDIEQVTGFTAQQFVAESET